MLEGNDQLLSISTQVAINFFFLLTGDMRCRLGDQAHAAGDFAEALRWYDTAVAFAPQNAANYLKRR